MKYNWDLIAWIGECDADHDDYDVDHLLELTAPDGFHAGNPIYHGVWVLNGDEVFDEVGNSNWTYHALNEWSRKEQEMLGAAEIKRLVAGERREWKRVNLTEGN